MIKRIILRLLSRVFPADEEEAARETEEQRRTIEQRARERHEAEREAAMLRQLSDEMHLTNHTDS